MTEMLQCPDTATVLYEAQRQHRRCREGAAEALPRKPRKGRKPTEDELRAEARVIALDRMDLSVIEDCYLQARVPFHPEYRFGPDAAAVLNATVTALQVPEAHVFAVGPETWQLRWGGPGSVP